MKYLIKCYLLMFTFEHALFNVLQTSSKKCWQSYVTIPPPGVAVV